MGQSIGESEKVQSPATSQATFLEQSVSSSLKQKKPDWSFTFSRDLNPLLAKEGRRFNERRGIKEHFVDEKGLIALIME